MDDVYVSELVSTECLSIMVPSSPLHLIVQYRDCRLTTAVAACNMLELALRMDCHMSYELRLVLLLLNNVENIFCYCFCCICYIGFV